LQEIVVFGRRKLEKIFLKVKQLKIKNNHKEIGINEIIKLVPCEQKEPKKRKM
jgi:hypothetical protein